MARPKFKNTNHVSLDLKPRKSIFKNKGLLGSFNDLIDVITAHLRPRDETQIVRHLVDNVHGHSPLGTKPHPTGINKGAPGAMSSTTSVNENPQTQKAIQENIEQGRPDAVPVPSPKLGNELINQLSPSPKVAPELKNH